MTAGTEREDPPALELRDVTKLYGELLVLDAVSLSVDVGARHALIGPNGAGKSTLFHVITGTQRVTRGRIVFAGKEITRVQEHVRTQLGLGRTFQQTSLFDGLSVLANVELAVQQQAGVARRLFPSARRRTRVSERGRELLSLVGLGSREAIPAGALSHGQRRQLDVAVSLATEPSLVLMDEPTAGMSRDEAMAFLAMIVTLPDSLTILMVEHDMDVVFELATWISVLDAGKLIADGTPEAIRGSRAVQDAYLGEGEHLAKLFESD
ncbi:MAG: ABC transporter ATP-binding protein [Gaiellaceae bacterium MAG52_C11]|nr:ABC transporter ATP-binding protein [Candidatus Gaiellasilicea maunaloa]